ncbi:putative heat shock protein GrpE [Clostridium bornimense]|uniref:Protein GrpE n=1 Tax=Clostridium bornimense TaxID=1216932 RepID=W6SG10_9CLOT|nr:putative heat shock protein GrpE [Clostridium bornimense]
MKEEMKDSSCAEESINEECTNNCEENIESDNVENNSEEESKVINEEDYYKVKYTKEAENSKKLSKEVEALRDKLMRLDKEYENHRNRSAKEKEEIYDNAVVDTLKEIVPAIDNLERAVSAVGDESSLRTGVEMTLKSLLDSLAKLGVEEISTEEGFDPNVHQAIMHIQDDSFGENEVVEVFQKGYKKESKVLRYSMVKVAN